MNSRTKLLTVKATRQLPGLTRFYSLTTQRLKNSLKGEPLFKVPRSKADIYFSATSIPQCRFQCLFRFDNRDGFNEVQIVSGLCQYLLALCK